MRILCIGDIHAPFIDKRVFSRILDRISIFKPQLIIQMGDAYDGFSWSRFPHRIINPQDEILEAYGVLTEFWKQLRKKRPKAKLIQLVGNHDTPRIDKLVKSKAPELLPFISTKQFWDFPGVEVIHDCREPFIEGNIVFTHGHRTKLAPHLQDFGFNYNVVIGHLHRAETHYERISDRLTLWAHCCGYIASPYSEGLSYRPLTKYFKWTQGITEIEHGQPRFIPL